MLLLQQVHSAAAYFICVNTECVEMISVSVPGWESSSF